MKIQVSTKLDPKTSCLVIPVFQDEKTLSVKASLEKNIQEIIYHTLPHFDGVLGNTITCSTSNTFIILLGLGEKKKHSNEQYRRAYSFVGPALRKWKKKEASILFNTENVHLVSAAVEGCILGAYSYTQTHTHNDPFRTITFISSHKKEIAEIESICNIVYFVRDIINTDPSKCTPAHLESESKKIAKSSGNIKLTVWDYKRLIKEGMHGIYHVGRGSSVAPRLLKLEYKKNPKNNKPIVLVGKGVTFDSGGYNIKPTEGIENMKIDMSGGAIVLGIFKLLSLFKPNLHVIGLIPAVENLVSSTAYKPGDILTMRNKKTVEVLNTDAEGRLILADALSYATEMNPKYIIDLATLTGAVIVALGYEYTGVMGTDDTLISKVKNAFKSTDEKVWQLPLDDDFMKYTKGTVSDIQNVAYDTKAGSIMGGAFLREFVGDVPWVHLDIAGTAYINKPHYYNPKGATAHGLRSLWKLIND